jgi:hypothetical protein
LLCHGPVLPERPDRGRRSAPPAGLARRFGGGAFAGDPAAVAVITAQLELSGWFATGERWPLAQAPVR